MNERPWLDTYGEHIPAEIDPDLYPSVVHLMQAAINRFSHLTAFRGAASALTYGEFDAKAGAFASHLQQRLGVKKGDRVAVMLPNLVAFPIAFAGITRAGAVQPDVHAARAGAPAQRRRRRRDRRLERLDPDADRDRLQS